MSPARAPFVSVIVPVLNGANTLPACLASIVAAEYPSARREVLVIDNGSTDCSREIAMEYPVRVLCEPRPGSSHARNRGIEAAAGDVLAFTDADCTVTRLWLRELVAGLHEHGAAAAMGTTVAFPPRSASQRYVARRRASFGQWSHPHPHPYLGFANAAIRRDAFERVGVLDTQFVGGSEDIDFSWRLGDAGLEFVHRPRAVVLHRHRTSASALFHQHIGYGRGQAALVRKYPQRVSWGWHAEARAWADLAASVGRLGATLARSPLEDPGSSDISYRSLDLVRKLGQRLGFLGALLTER